MSKSYRNPLPSCAFLCVQIVEEFHNIFDSQLKAVTNDPKYINELPYRVNRLLSPIMDIRFDPFNISKMSKWKQIMHEFNRRVQVSFGCLRWNCWTISEVTQ